MNTQKVEAILQSLFEISGMDVAVVNAKNRILARRYSGALYCKSIHKSQKCLDMCTASDKCKLCEAHSEEKMVFYKCPFGIYEAIVPIKKANDIIAYLFVGLGLEDSESGISEPLLSALDVAPNLNRESLVAGIEAIPRFSKKKLEAYASLLPIIAEHLEINDLIAESDMTLGQLVKRYIKDNISTKITLNELALKMHCSTVTLTEHFKREFGITIVEYVNQKRIQKAKQLLQNSSLSIREISETCGFSSVEYFSRSFKESVGQAPSVWQKHRN